MLAISLLPLSTQEKYLLAKENPSINDLKGRGVSPDRVERMLSYLSQSGANVCFYGMDTYPKAFLELENPPFRLMYTKNLPSSEENLLTLCGSRYTDLESATASYTLALEAAVNAVSLVCSNSHGIDRSALYAYQDYKANAYVLCDCGLATDRVKYNPLTASMNMVSAFEPDDEALPFRCLSRNILSASLSMATVVMQSPKRSGALHVASSALDLGKDVFVHASGAKKIKQYFGSYGLVEMGAVVVDDFAALASHLNLECKNTLRRGSFETSLYRFGSGWYNICYGK